MSAGPNDYDIVDENGNTYSVDGWDDDTEEPEPDDEADTAEAEDEAYGYLNLVEGRDY